MLVLIAGSDRDDAKCCLQGVRVKPIEVILEANLEGSLSFSGLLSFPNATGVMWHGQEIAFEGTFSSLHDVPPLGNCRVAGEYDLLLATFQDENCTCEIRIAVVHCLEIRYAVSAISERRQRSFR